MFFGKSNSWQITLTVPDGFINTLSNPLRDILKGMYIGNQVTSNYMTVRFRFTATDSLFTCNVQYVSDLETHHNFHKFMMIKHFTDVNTVIYEESGIYKRYSDSVIRVA